MFDLDREVKRWCRQMHPGLFFQKRFQAELEDHLHCDIARLVQQGRTPSEAFHLATLQLGESASLRSEYRKNWNRLTATIDAVESRFAPWRETESWWIRLSAWGTVGAALGIVFAGWFLQGSSISQWTYNLSMAIYAFPFALFGAAS